MNHVFFHSFYPTFRRAASSAKLYGSENDQGARQQLLMLCDTSLLRRLAVSPLDGDLEGMALMIVQERRRDSSTRPRHALSGTRNRGGCPPRAFTTVLRQSRCYFW